VVYFGTIVGLMTLAIGIKVMLRKKKMQLTNRRIELLLLIDGYILDICSRSYLEINVFFLSTGCQVRYIKAGRIDHCSVFCYSTQ
jgi:hypothetical protein